MTPKIQSFERIVPMIYAYTTPNYPPHDGWTKIGYTDKQTVSQRIHQQSHTVDVATHLEWKSEARFTDGSGEYFTDHDFHDYLTKHLHVKRKGKTEWFQIDGKTSKEYFYHFRDKDFAFGCEDEHKQYVLRQEQAEAVTKTLAYYQSDKLPREFLWNAKPRFGKTLTTYDLVRKIQAQNVLIVTNRPSIANSWYDDFTKFIGWQTHYQFVSDADSLSNRDTMSREDYLQYLSKLSDADKAQAGMIAFISLQDLKGSVYFGGKYQKLKWVRDLNWDLLVIDEAHEGVDTYKTDKAFDRITRNFTLHLSGTPFKAIAKGKFRAEQIFNWSYLDEQQAKANWQEETQNPYAGLPKLNMLTYQLSNMLVDKTKQGMLLDEDDTVDYAFDLNEFFSTNESGRFKYEDDVKKFLNALTSQKKFPFSTPELREELAHTFWLLHRVDSAKALAKLLHKHPVFKDYEIVLAAGDGKTEDAMDDSINQKSFDKVQKAIAEHDKTITLSVGQLTTGVTVKPWTAVLMLSNMKSPAEYMQAAFRAQNPYQYEKNGQLYRKENAYLFDFAPERTLTIYDEFANNLSSHTANGQGTKEEHEQNIRQLLNFFPIYGENEDGEMVAVNAEQVLTMPKAIKAEEVVRRGFMSNLLFQNISNVFAAPAVVRKILQQIPPQEKQGKKNQASLEDMQNVAVDANGQATVANQIVVNRTEAIFGKGIAETAQQELRQAIPEQEALSGKVKEEKTEDYATASENAAKQMVTIATKIASDVLHPHIEQQAKQDYSLSHKQSERLEKRVQQELQTTFQQTADEHITQTRILQAENQEKLKKVLQEQEKAQSLAEQAKVAKKINALQAEVQQQMQAANQAFLQTMQTKMAEAVAQQTQKVTEQLEVKQAERQQKSVEDKVRAHLRGFARTIPSFIMAYSEKERLEHLPPLCLANFDDYTPDDVFAETTGITEEQFRFLRDGGDYIDEDTGEKEHFAGHLFAETVFDEAIQKFLRKKQELNNYFAEEQKEDIFDWIPPQKTNQIFTPKKVVTQMLDAMEQQTPDIFNDDQRTFVDFYMKSGLYIAEIVKRLYRSEVLQKKYPDSHARVKHILEKQVFGFAPSQIIYDIAIAYIFGFNAEAADISHANFIQEDTTPYIKQGKLAELVQKHFGN